MIETSTIKLKKNPETQKKLIIYYIYSYTQILDFLKIDKQLNDMLLIISHFIPYKVYGCKGLTLKARKSSKRLDMCGALTLDIILPVTILNSGLNKEVYVRLSSKSVFLKNINETNTANLPKLQQIIVLSSKTKVGIYQFSEFFIVKKCLKSGAQDLITDRRESELKKSVITYEELFIKFSTQKKSKYFENYKHKNLMIFQLQNYLQILVFSKDLSNLNIW
ncbi:Uncharacterized protein FWK35_00013580 [Aphis craccivora]|uniref:Uncharacterized protein n=1 Tax=Aphis craccivora TaxID=307492 RepID=A0A6G0Y5E8_APHCR|nr:Uncharacterized protein FWK35_00013580 [Aphis craccivora]